ncbi:MAG: sel1 repeat family protein [Bacteroidales bacterium]|nr:sel1 repeat family protein [Bacteroidales bacterium]
MKTLRNILLCVILLTCAFSMDAQVKQIFKVVDITTGKPLSDATMTIYGQTLQTNAKGVAVITLPADRKGAYIAQDKWYKEGYVELSNFASYRHRTLQSSDTLFSYQIPEELFRQEMTDIFMKLYTQDIDTLQKKIRKVYAENKDDAKGLKYFAQSLFDDAAGLMNGNADADLSDAFDIVNMLYNDRQLPADIRQALRDCDINKAVSLAREQIKADDVSLENLTNIARYLDLKTLYACTKDTSADSPYSKILYEQHFAEDATILHLYRLSAENRYDEYKEIVEKEKDKNLLENFNILFEDNPFQYEGKDYNKYRAAAARRIEVEKQVLQKHPEAGAYKSVSNAYEVLYYTDYRLGDTVKMMADLDSVFAYQNRYAELYRQGAFKNDLIALWSLSRPIGAMRNQYHSCNNARIIEIASKIMNIAEHLYRNNPDNPMAQVLYGVKAYDCYALIKELDDENETYSTVTQKLNEIQQILLPKYREYTSIGNMQATSDLYWQSIFNDQDEATVKNNLKDYRASFDLLQNLFPMAFVDNYLSFNTIIEAYMAAEDKYLAVNELTDFNEELLKLQATKEGKSLATKKALYYNNVAEKLYSYELYEKGISQYQRANDYFKQAIADDHHNWISYLGNLLQMGDAYLYSKQYDNAIASYRKILAEEPNIPADIMPKYLNMKGQAYWYEGDVYGTLNDASAANKCYKTAEKWLKKAIAAGDSTAFRSLGEMYFNKGINTYKAGDIKKAYQLIGQSEGYYATYPLETPSERYESVLDIMEEYYSEQENVTGLIQVEKEKAAYYKQFADASLKHRSNYVESLRKLTKLYTLPQITIPYREEYLQELLVLANYRENMELPYMQGCFAMAEDYRQLDSAEKAIEYYERCVEMNDIIYRDTARTEWEKNMIDIDIPLSACYEAMAEVDTADAKQWYLKSIETRDSLTSWMKKYCALDEKNLNLAYKLSYQYYRNALVCAEAEMPYMGLEILDKSDAILLDFYNGEYRSAVEEDLVRNYWLRGAIYDEEDDVDKAKELYGNAIKCADNAIDPSSVAKWAVVSISSYIDLLEDDPTADPNQIKALKQKLATYSKMIGR